MFERNTNNTIAFTYEVDDLFTDASRVSAFTSKNLRDKEGNAMVDTFALSEDERGVYLQGMKSILPDIYDLLIKLTSDIDNAFIVSDTEIKFIINDNDAYNANLLLLLYNAIRETLIQGSLKVWYRTSLHGDLFKIYNESYQQSLTELYNRLFQLKRKRSVAMLGTIS